VNGETPKGRFRAPSGRSKCQRQRNALRFIQCFPAAAARGLPSQCEGPMAMKWRIQQSTRPSEKSPTETGRQYN